MAWLYPSCYNTDSVTNEIRVRPGCEDIALSEVPDCESPGPCHVRAHDWDVGQTAKAYTPECYFMAGNSRRILYSPECDYDEVRAHTTNTDLQARAFEVDPAGSALDELCSVIAYNPDTGNYQHVERIWQYTRHPDDDLHANGGCVRAWDNQFDEEAQVVRPTLIPQASCRAFDPHHVNYGYKPVYESIPA